jgi:hypothetical protein
LLLANLFLLLGDLLSQGIGHTCLPLLLLALLDGLAVLLERLIAGITGKPDQTIRFLGGQG